jgi:transcriptional regulator with XRE-family HTH domain
MSSAATQVIIRKLNTLIQLDGVSQAELSRRVGIQPSHLNRYLKGHGDIRSALLISVMEELGIDICEILEREILRRRPKSIVSLGITESESTDQVADLLTRMPSAERRALTLLIQKMSVESRTGAARRELERKSR